MTKRDKRRCSVHLVVVVLCLVIDFSDTQLVINVRNQGGDVVQENIFANVTDDTVSLEFQRSDGTLITQVIDFRNVSTSHMIYSPFAELPLAPLSGLVYSPANLRPICSIKIVYPERKNFASCFSIGELCIVLGREFLVLGFDSSYFFLQRGIDW
ncbi:hypothetical protein Zmor_009327 [Zophobas morio]|uniref:Out at first protein BRICHOS-like domain-containing protein n=1 Tax=Zophobas morio TaxID=2755281 RepID=A0AA38MIA4_9CUCU|nr:hypothetical protein Zmor_009327 [Zophobas morio]